MELENLLPIKATQTIASFSSQKPYTKLLLQ